MTTEDEASPEFKNKKIELKEHILLENRKQEVFEERKDGTVHMSSVILALWDFGGQEVFHSLHHLFLTKNGLYCLVFDLVRLVQYPKESLSKLSFWAESLLLHARQAPVILVGVLELVLEYLVRKKLPWQISALRK